MKHGPLCPVLLWVCLAAGCAPQAAVREPVARQQLRARAVECLKRGVGYEYLPSVRTQAIESLQAEAPSQGLPYIRSALTDSHPAARFAACMALGTLRDAGSRPILTRMLNDPDDSVKAAAIYALHQLGETRHTARLAGYLRDHDDPYVRRNAALILGRLGEEGAVRLLAGVVNSKDDALHVQALESLALLGNEQARKQLAFTANSGRGWEEVFALTALAATEDPQYADLFRYKLENGDFQETRLAAARGLGELQVRKGLDLALAEALKGIRFNAPKRDAAHQDDQAEGDLIRTAWRTGDRREWIEGAIAMWMDHPQNPRSFTELIELARGLQAGEAR